MPAAGRNRRRSGTARAGEQTACQPSVPDWHGACYARGRVSSPWRLRHAPRPCYAGAVPSNPASARRLLGRLWEQARPLLAAGVPVRRVGRELGCDPRVLSVARIGTEVANTSAVPANPGRQGAPTQVGLARPLQSESSGTRVARDAAGTRLAKRDAEPANPMPNPPVPPRGGTREGEGKSTRRVTSEIHTTQFIEGSEKGPAEASYISPIIVEEANELEQYRALLKRRIPIRKRVEIYVQILKQKSNPAATQRALERIDELNGFIAQKPDPDAARPLFNYSALAEVSVGRSEPPAEEIEAPPASAPAHIGNNNPLPTGVPPTPEGDDAE